MKRDLFIFSFNRRTRQIISCLIVFFLLLISVMKCADLLEAKEARKEYAPFFEGKTNYDVIFMGTSHMYNSVYPMEMWRDYGISSYNWGYANCLPVVDYYLIQDIIKYTSPKVVVIDVFGIAEYGPWTKYREDAIGQSHVQYDSIPLSREKIRAAREAFDAYPGNDDFIWDFIMYHNRWNKLTKDDFEYEYTTEKGASICSGSLGMTSYNSIPKEWKSEELYGFNYDCYLALIDYCNKHGIQVLAAYIPFAAEEYNQRIANTIGNIVEEYPNCKYVNMLDEGILDFETDVIADKEHLNYSGGAKVTSWLGRYLKDNYELDDYSENEYWINDYKNYHDHKKDLMCREDSLPLYLAHLYDRDFSGEVRIFDETITRDKRLMHLMDNSNVAHVIQDGHDNICAELTIRSNISGELIEQAEFEWQDADERDMFDIVKVLR